MCDEVDRTRIRQAKLPQKARKLFDGGGLYLYLTPSGKYWYYRYYFVGREKTMALGKYPQVSLKEARLARMEAKIKLRSGIDPAGEQKRLKRENERFYAHSFEVVAREWYAHTRPSWKNAKHAQQVINTLSQYVFPVIGAHSVADVPPMEIFKLLNALKDKPETASRVKQRIKAVFDFAIQTGRATQNPALSAPKIIRRAGNRVKHHPALPKEKLKTFFQDLENHPNRMTQLSIQFMILTFTRSQEIRFAQWEEIKNNEWHIPAERMKMQRAHIVPLSTWALEILQELKEMNKNKSIYLFVGNRNRPMSVNTLSYAMKKMGYKDIAIPHGFRSMASTILNESGLFNPDAIERQLAHAERNAVRAAYNRAEYLEERRRMMQWYSDTLWQLIHG